MNVPGEPTETGTALLETATGTIQGFQPVKSIHEHLCAYVLCPISSFMLQNSILVISEIY
jgi:hypothetical protein